MAKTALKVLGVVVLVVARAQLVAFAPHAGTEGSPCVELYQEHGSETSMMRRPDTTWLPLRETCVIEDGRRLEVTVVEAAWWSQLLTLVMAATVTAMWLRRTRLGALLGFMALGIAWGGLLLFLGGYQAGAFMGMFTTPVVLLWPALRRRHALHALAGVASGWIAWFVWLFWLFWLVEDDTALLRAAAVLVPLALVASRLRLLSPAAA